MAQMRHLRQFLRTRQNAGDETQGQIRQGDLVVARARRQQFGQPLPKSMPLEKTGEGQKSGSSTDFLVGEADLNGFFAVRQFNEFGHCLVSRFLSGSRLFFH